MTHTLEQKREHSRVWRQENKDEHNRKQREWNRTNPQARWAINLRRYHGIEPEDYAWQLHRQSFRCPICRLPFGGATRVHVDHCHRTGRLRGILCHRCNIALGFIEKSDLHRMQNYLDEHEWPKAA
jgi:hypothetical protein